LQQKNHRQPHHLHGAAGWSSYITYDIYIREAGSPTLPPPGRPPEGEGSNGSTMKRWIGQEI
jgi:hypothetical protein